MKISIGGYSFNNLYMAGQIDIFGYLEAVKFRYRLSTADLWNGLFADRSGPLLKLADESYIRKIREALEEKELTVVNLAVDGAHLWDPDPDLRRRLHENALEHLRAAEILGARSVRIDTGGAYTSGEKMSGEQFDFVVKGYRALAERAAAGGYKIGPENHMGASLDPNEMKRLAEAVDHPSYGILLHMGRWKADPEQGDALTARWAYHTHFDAETARDPQASSKVRLLQDAGYDGYWGVEYNAKAHTHIELEWAVASVKRAVARA
ncbi:MULTISPECIES: sugar phosphate isomerase/epimerase family protein [Paenibacillus]|uniref:sugar phosphate isomerase/epimerase family protein n=1 Tax=Paenibacillus TaxID=44249 RepID=UPI0022B93652|nr:TIM barrel protein [Paenibacillus caseinilyticus]MCZ8520456.1 TIM barrel protein [Paenibacillus caseinilyticus]